jgi:Putative peptidoglycan binding domain
MAPFEERRFGGWLAAGAPLLRIVRRRPHDAFAAAVAGVAAVAVALNVLWLQPPHPAPMFQGKARPVASSDTTGSLTPVLPRPRPAEQETATLENPPPAAKAQDEERLRAIVRSSVQPVPLPAVKPVKRDPALHPVPAKRVAAVQRALADFGYGQLAPTGVPDAATKAAIERFERERKLPVTGQLSDRLVREVAAVTGRRLD